MYTKFGLIRSIRFQDTKFGLNRSIRFQDIEQNSILTSIKGSNSVANLPSLPARMRLIKSKMKELECSQDFPHYKSMGIFPDAQGQLTPQSLVRSGRISNSFEILWMSSVITCKYIYEEDPIKNEGARVVTTFFPL